MINNFLVVNISNVCDLIIKVKKILIKKTLFPGFVVKCGEWFLKLSGYPESSGNGS